MIASGAPDEVKKMIRGAIIEIRSSDPRGAAALLKERLGAGAVGLFGDKVHVTTEEPEETIAGAGAILKEGGFEVSAIRRIEPSLEDVFVSVVAREEGGGDGEK
jgi:ABC-2 type transport system ATP-binding protein